MPLIVTAGDITSAIIRIDAAAQGVNAVFQACPSLDANTQKVWGFWYAGWQKWVEANKDVSNFNFGGLPNIGDQAADYENEIKDWQKKANDICGTQIPAFVTQGEAADANLSVPDSPGLDSAFSAAKWIAGAVIAALIVPPIVETIRTFHRVKTAGKSKSDGKPD